MYQTNPSGTSYRFKSFLEEFGIRTTRNVEGRSRAVSIRDVHSLRHTFAYMAGVYQIPLPVVQSILGHMSPEMTKHYQAHADREAKEKYLARMPDSIGHSEVKAIESSDNIQREQLIQQMKGFPPDQLEIVAKFLRTL